ncbi:hypothetical protein FGK63_02595 [Ruegeria sediminis]|uniref:DUF945 family protein n=1 Tax=Ruegeria sediminis TaxID=2583820 RepID=A0ABY2X3L8_9RHOB|nr:hypothetical protein [Ruegeria sediminis]TMV09979.1 hypothetical protein FGK63_02595 [Ruegeria sediminis]
MGILRGLGFLVICALVFLGLDYYQQDRKSEDRLSLRGYADAIADRFDLYQAGKAAEQAERDRQKRWRAGGKAYLPEPADAWARRSVLDGDIAASVAEDTGSGLAPGALVTKMAEQNAAIQAEKLDKRGWVYERDGKTAWLEIDLVSGSNANSLAGAVEQTIAALDFGDIEEIPLGVIGGVAFVERLHFDTPKAHRQEWALVTSTPAQKGEVGFHTYSGIIGFDEEVRITLRTDAEQADVRDLLARLDYDTLNGLLRIPVPTVGNGVAVQPEQEQDLAARMNKLHAEFIRLRAEVAQTRLNNIDGASLIANTFAQSRGLPEGIFDLTGGRVETMEDMIQTGYRQALSDMMDADMRKTESGIGNLLGGFFAKSDATPADSSAAAAGAGAAGLFGTVKSFFSNSDKVAGAGKQDAIRVNKGISADGKGCSVQGILKRCATGGG